MSVLVWLLPIHCICGRRQSQLTLTHPTPEPRPQPPWDFKVNVTVNKHQFRKCWFKPIKTVHPLWIMTLRQKLERRVSGSCHLLVKFATESVFNNWPFVQSNSKIYTIIFSPSNCQDYKAGVIFYSNMCLLMDKTLPWCVSRHVAGRSPSVWLCPHSHLCGCAYCLLGSLFIEPLKSRLIIFLDTAQDFKNAHLCHGRAMKC